MTRRPRAQRGASSAALTDAFAAAAAGAGPGTGRGSGAQVVSGPSPGLRAGSLPFSEVVGDLAVDAGVAGE